MFSSKKSSEKMNLTRNEKKALKIMLENAKASDSYIASKLNISSQAVGKIRRKLENTFIDSYTIKLNYEKLGIHTFALASAKPTHIGIEKGVKEIEQKLLDNPHILQVYRLQTAEAKYIILYAFHDIDELDRFFHISQQDKELHSLIENKEIHTFSHTSIIKNDPIKLFHKAIDELFTTNFDSQSFPNHFNNNQFKDNKKDYY